MAIRRRITHLGNHYQWNAATAGTGGTITGVQASSSICPKGWKLPTGNSTIAGSFGGLVGAGNIGTDTAKIASEPYYFVRGGYVDMANTILFTNAGRSGFYWSSTATSGSDAAYSLWFYSTNSVEISNSDPRQSGLSIRCIAR